MIAQADCEHLPLADNSLDLIFTDPPYSEKFLQCYSWLAQEAARTLKPGGFVLAMAGGYFLDHVMQMMGEHLCYHWKLELFMTDVSTVIWPRRVIARSKPILAYSKGTSNPRCNVLGAMYGGGNDKRFHNWGQDVESARYYIDCFSAPGDLVCDPFVGGGTTPIACGLIGRRCVSFDTDPIALYTTRTRRDGAGVPMDLPLFNIAYSPIE